MSNKNITATEVMIIEAEKQYRKTMRDRENKVQSLLRHAFSCSHNKKCSCARNIQEFLQSDIISIVWAKEQKESNSPTKST